MGGCVAACKNHRMLIGETRTVHKKSRCIITGVGVVGKKDIATSLKVKTAELTHIVGNIACQLLWLDFRNILPCFEYVCKIGVWWGKEFRPIRGAISDGV